MQGSDTRSLHFGGFTSRDTSSRVLMCCRMACRIAFANVSFAVPYCRMEGHHRVDNHVNILDDNRECAGACFHGAEWVLV